MSSKKIKKVLVANRGEIAARIAKTLQKLEISSVGLYVDLEKSAPYLAHFDETHMLSINQLSAFLGMDEIIKIAKDVHADAIHPGYGFLSENADFAKKVEDAGIIWIGPTSDVIAKLGNKEQAKEIARQTKVTVLDNIFEKKENDTTFVKNISAISFPIIIKPLMGGGGKGMQILHDDQNLEEKLEESRSVAKNAFGDGRLMAESYIENPKHIEVQVIRDEHGNAYALGERDCTIQRRHQKIIEESPSVAIDDKQRKAIFKDAITLIDHVGYTNVGTVEFLVDSQGQHYFMEVNTRLQVEHVVTEMVFDIDLVQAQINVARGEKLDYSNVKTDGHAIEIRVYAENPDLEFLPATGIISHVELPQDNAWTRVDHNVMQGQHITSMFDPLVLKLTVWGKTREETIQELLHQMTNLQLVGVMTNITYIAWVLRHEDFQQHDHHTQWVKDTFDAYMFDRKKLLDEAVRVWQYQTWEQNISSWHDDPWNNYEPHATPSIDHITWNQEAIPTNYMSTKDDPWIVQHRFYRVGNKLWISFDNQWYVFIEKDLSQSSSGTSYENSVKAPMTGTIVKVHADIGDSVKKDQVLVEMEAMKMQYKLVSPVDGTIDKLHCAETQVVNQDQVLIEVL